MDDSSTSIDQRVQHATGPWLAGGRSAALTLVHAALAAGGAGATVAALYRLARTEPRLQALAREAEGRASGLDRVVALLAAIEHDAPRDTAAIAAMFDRAVALDEISSVALYALGDETLLHDAADEITALLLGWSLLRPTTRLLDIGCGIGRFARSLAPLVATYRGLDISGGMLAAARRRCTHANARFDPCDGRSLAGAANASYDLVLAVDVVPYWHQAAVTDAMLREVRRVLAPDGSMVVLGWSYEGTDEAQAREARLRAAAHDLTLQQMPSQLQRWDTPVFLFLAT